MPAPGPAPDRSRPTGVWRGVVTRLSGGLPMVEVPRLARGYEFGPCETLYGPWTAGALTGADGGHTDSGGTVHPDHTHPAGSPLAAGTRVLVAFVEGRPDDVVVVGVLP